MSNAQKANLLQGKDLITTGIFSAIYLVLHFICMLIDGLHPLVWRSAWLTDYRINRAAALLLKGDRPNISEIGGIVGYESASKFAAIKKALKLTPSEYQRERGIYHEE